MQPDRHESALERPLEVYRDHQDEFAAEHHGQYVVIHGDEIIGFYDDELEAYYEAKARYEVGTFLLRRCSKPEEEFEPTFHSRVA